MSNIIEIRNISKIYGEGSGKTVALNNISLEIAEGEFVAIIGPSGSGKTTLLNILGTLDKPTAGSYLYRGKEISRMSGLELAKFRNKQIGFIVQDYALIEYDTVYKNVEIPLKYAHKKYKKETIIKMLNELGIGEKENAVVKNLSGGQKQRTAIARALVNDAEVILADEPTGALDSESGKQILNILKDINRQGKTVIVVTHDNEIANQCERIITIKDGRVYSIQ